MPPSPRKSMKERALFSLTSSLPCASYLKGVLCSHLRSLWMVLMMLTVLCVVIQILGLVWQSRNDKILSENVRFTIEFQRTLPSGQRDWEHLRSQPATVVEEVRSLKEEEAPRQWSKGIQKTSELKHNRDDYPGAESIVQEHERYSNPSNPALARRLDNTLNRVIDSNKVGGKVSAGKAALSKDTVDPDKLGISEPGVLQPPGQIHKVPTQVHKPPQLPSGGWSPDSANGLKSINIPASPSSTLPDLQVVHNNSDNSFAGLSMVKAMLATCQPKNHIVFLKTHKTASSTILNILYRYGDSRNLTFALPLNKHSQLFYPFYFASHFVEGIRSRSVKEFHIMCNHMRFRLPEVRKVMPEDTFYFSILRNPVAMMESSFIYYKSIPAFHKARSLDDFLDNGLRGYNTSLTNNHYARNILSFDFGFDNNVAVDAPELETRVAAAITAIEGNFHLILISEYFDESMILLKRALCWSLDDVVSFKLNSRSERTRHTLSPHTADKIRSWNALDWRLYLHFNATFWRRVDTTVGREEMRRAVARLQERRAQLAKTCLKDGGAVDPSQVKDAGLKPFQYGAAIIQGYNLNPGLDGPSKTRCQNLITPELQYTDALYAKQFPELVARQRQAAKMATKMAASRGA